MEFCDVRSPLREVEQLGGKRRDHKEVRMRRAGREEKYGREAYWSHCRW